MASSFDVSRWFESSLVSSKARCSSTRVDAARGCASGRSSCETAAFGCGIGKHALPPLQPLPTGSSPAGSCPSSGPPRGAGSPLNTPPMGDAGFTASRSRLRDPSEGVALLEPSLFGRDDFTPRPVNSLPRPTRRSPRRGILRTARCGVDNAQRGDQLCFAWSSPAPLVREFHVQFGLTMYETPTLDLPEELVRLRTALVQEEAAELFSAVSRYDIVQVADGLADLVYVLYGTALTFGIDLDAVVREVHRSNMTKLGPDGKPIVRADGKVLKGPNYEPPNLRRVLGLTPDSEVSPPLDQRSSCDHDP